MDSIQDKFCTRCNLVKPVSGFTKNKSRPDGLSLYCRVCDSERGKEYRKTHSDLVRAQDKAYYDKNRKRVAERHRLWWIERKKRGPVPNYDTTPEQKRRHALKYLYGITPEFYDNLYVSQGGKCGLCGLEKKLVVDHDHATDEVRGLLCKRCNGGFASLGDDKRAIDRIARYLKLIL